jgi:hypothetical protein
MICVFLQISGVQSKEDEMGGSRNTHGGVYSVYNILVTKHIEKIPVPIQSRSRQVAVRSQ